jgi:EPS-associated MarR family transcriptional regulator
MVSRQSQLQEDKYFRVLRILADKPDINQRKLAERLGISLGGLNYCLRALIDKGFVKLENFQDSKHKLKYVYVLTPAGMAVKFDMTRKFIDRKMKEYRAIEAEIKSLSDEMNHLPIQNITRQNQSIDSFE